MNISDKHVVTLNYTLKDGDNNILDKSDDGSFCYLHGASNIIPGLENALTGKAAGDQLSVSVSPEDGYGLRDDEKMQDVPRDAFPADQNIEAGMQFQAEGPDEQAIMVTIASIKGDTVKVDGNHPLAGITLHFDVNIAEVRDASAEELDHGHVHGTHGHDHG